MLRNEQLGQIILKINKIMVEMGLGLRFRLAFRLNPNLRKTLMNPIFFNL